MKKYLLLSIILILGIGALAQPVVTNIDPVSTYPGGEVVIAGVGFGNSASDVIVWFGGVKSPNLISVTNTSIVAEVPAAAPNSSIYVQRISSGLLGQSDEHFFIRHYGSTFDINDFETELQFADNAIQKPELCGCDFDGDGKVDIVTVQESGTSITLLRNSSAIGSISFTTSQLNVVTPTIGVSCGDLDGDGKSDLFMVRSGANKNQVYVYRNTSSVGSITFGSQNIINLLTNDPTGSPYQGSNIMAADLTGDGKLDLVVTNQSSQQPLINIIVNQSTIGNLSFGTPQIFDLADQSTNRGLDIEDIDGDGNLDLILTKSGGSDVFIYRNLGGGSLDFAAPEILSTGSEALVSVNAYDLDGDGKKEIVTTEALGSGVLIYKNNSTPGNFSFDSPSTTLVGLTPTTFNSEPYNTAAADFNGDGLLDLAVSSRAESSYSVLINQGGLSFSVSTKTIAYATRNVYAGDFDGDGKPDIAFTSLQLPNGNFSVEVVRNANCYRPQFLNDQPIAICATQTLTLDVPKSPGTTFSWKKDGGDLGLSTTSIDITTFGDRKSVV